MVDAVQSQRGSEKEFLTQSWRESAALWFIIKNQTLLCEELVTK